MNSSSTFFVPGAPINVQSCNYPFIEIEQQRAGIKKLPRDFTINNPSIGTNLHWIRVKDVLGCAIPDTLDRPRFQGICLSCSFFQLLTRRYFGFACVEEGDETVKDFMLGMLQTDYEGAFNMVEVQLAFLHDYFFTENFILMLAMKSYNSKSVLLYIASECILFLLYFQGMGQPKLSGFAIYEFGKLAAELYIFVRHLPVLTSDWCTVRHAAESFCEGRVYLLSCSEWFADRLKSINGPPTNGSTSLRRNGVLGHFDWTLKQETHIHTILTWHIATCYCDMFPPAEESSSDREVATTLSGYCAYLVAFLPELLAENSLITSMVLQQVLGEAKEALGRRRRLSMEAKLRRIQEVELPEDGAAGLRDLTTFRKGVRLGRQLEQQQPDALARWKVMVDFWAETILYVAPSDNGEFVTHLWALLSNAGIHKRAMEQKHISPSATDHAQAEAGTEPEDFANSRETRRVLRNRRKPNPRVTGPEWVN
ncbi:uncharacterized protein C2845_PM17G13640 [Panicum miliaceum]|uniref:DUF4220 domain-containing protein n=1 Tax=Panicum miliaceum TaxID=4540 RepID=A0A3L6Q0F6_PANMI|nr:uncharacterized protein C2845_PM17G13640 [Panicum miliaceum]